MEQLIAFDAAPQLVDGSGSGSGSGAGYGSGYGYGYGYGYGSGDGYGYGSGSGSGAGSGSGYGSGYGYGYGDGYGSGSGAGSGSGYGYGSGSGYGYGYGSGSGSGSGAGYGSGYGYGSGDGYGYGDEINNVAYYAAVASAYSRGSGVVALWRSTVKGTPANGGHLPPVAVDDVHETDGPLTLCQSGTLHATFHPQAWKGERWWAVAMHGEIAVGENKIGALKREILAEITA